MNRLVLFFVLSLFPFLMCSGQLPSGSTAPNFIVTDVDGEVHNLYEILDSGKSVLLDLFAVWCGPCWTFAEMGVFEDFNETYGNSIVAIAVEADPSTPADFLDGGGNSIGDWTELIGYSLANDDLIGDDYQLSFYPTIYLICPDRTVNQIGQTSPQGGYWNVPSLAQEVFQYTCESIEGVNGNIQSYNSELNFCGQEKIEPVVSISNSGSEVITSCTVETIFDGEVISSTDWNGFLPYLATEQVVLDEIPGSLLNVTFNIQVDGDVLESDNSISVQFIPSLQSHGFVNVVVNTDFYPSQTSWEIKNSSGQVVYYMTYDGEDSGGGVNAGTEHNHSVTLVQDCYTFRAMDSQGNGQPSFSAPGFTQAGSIIVTDANELELLNISGDWGAMQSVDFEVSLGLGIEDDLHSSINLFPNPASLNSALKFKLSESNKLSIKVFNLMGQTVFFRKENFSAGEHEIQFPIAQWSPGVYHVTTFLGNESYDNKLVIID